MLGGAASAGSTTLPGGSTVIFTSSLSGRIVNPDFSVGDLFVIQDDNITVTVTPVTSVYFYDSTDPSTSLRLKTPGHLSFQIQNNGNVPLAYTTHIESLSGGSFTYQYGIYRPQEYDPFVTFNGPDLPEQTQTLAEYNNNVSIDVTPDPQTPTGTYLFKITTTVSGHPELTHESTQQVTVVDYLAYQSVVIGEPKRAVPNGPTLHAIYYVNLGSTALDPVTLSFTTSDQSSTSHVYSYAFVRTPYLKDDLLPPDNADGGMGTVTAPPVPTVPAGTLFFTNVQTAWTQANARIEHNEVWALIVRTDTTNVDPNTSGLRLTVDSTGRDDALHESYYAVNYFSHNELITLLSGTDDSVLVLLSTQICKQTNCTLIQRDNTRTFPGNVVRYTASLAALGDPFEILPAAVLKLDIPAGSVAQQLNAAYTSGQYVPNSTNVMYRLSAHTPQSYPGPSSDLGQWTPSLDILGTTDATVEVALDTNQDGTIDAQDTTARNTNLTMTLDVKIK